MNAVFALLNFMNLILLLTNIEVTRILRWSTFRPEVRAITVLGDVFDETGADFAIAYAIL